MGPRGHSISTSSSNMGALLLIGDSVCACAGGICGIGGVLIGMGYGICEFKLG